MTAQRTFRWSDQQAFAALSGDANPIHVDALAARRLMFGHAVVHGLHGLLWALDQWCVGHGRRARLSQLRADFQRPIGVDDVVRLEQESASAESAELRLHANGRMATRIRLSWGADESGAEPAPAAAPPGAERACLEWQESELPGRVGRLPLYLDPSLAATLFPHALNQLPTDQLASLLATTRLVGMECPGRHSIFSQLAVGFRVPRSPETPAPAALAYRVDSVDERFHLANIGVESPSLAGSIRAFLRPAPRAQLDCESARAMVRPKEFCGRSVWIVGGSRGLGEVSAKLLAAGGAAVTIIYRRGRADAAGVVDEIRRAGGQAEMRELDVLDLPAALLAADEGPTELHYFATPHIAAGERGGFSPERFHRYADYYVTAFIRLVQALTPFGLTRVLYPSSVFVDDPPDTLLEYAAAKAAGETACAWLEKGARGLRIARPRLPRMATDQTASIAVAQQQAEPAPVIVEALRALARGVVTP